MKKDNELKNLDYLDTKKMTDKLDSNFFEYYEKELIRAAKEKRKFNMPHIKNNKGQVRGEWKDSAFYLDDDFIPKISNKNKLTVKEIKNDLMNEYNIF